MNPNPYQPPQFDAALRTELPVLPLPLGSEDLAVEFQLEPADLVQFQQFHIRASRSRGSHVYRVIVAVSWLGLIGLSIREAMDDPKFWFAVGLFVLAPGLYFLLQFFVPNWRQISLIQRLTEPHNALLFARTRVAITSDSFNHATPFALSVSRWAAIEKIASDAKAVYFYYDSDTSQIVPRRAFATDEDFRGFVRSAQEFHARAIAAENPLRTSP